MKRAKAAISATIVLVRETRTHAAAPEISNNLVFLKHLKIKVILYIAMLMP
jgi:hypothetical protein